MEHRLHWPHTTKEYKIVQKSIKQQWPTTNGNSTCQGEENLIPELPYYKIQNVHFSTKNYQACKETKKYSPYARRKKKKKLIETVPEEAHALHLLDKDLKSTVIYSQRYKGTTDKKIKGSQHGVSPNRISIKW